MFFKWLAKYTSHYSIFTLQPFKMAEVLKLNFEKYFVENFLDFRNKLQNLVCA